MIFSTSHLVNVNASEQEETEIQNLDVLILDKIEHNRSSWTQGLLILDGYIYESTGLYNHSTLQRINLTTGEQDKIFYHNESIFAEGLTYYNRTLIQLTYKSNIAFVFDIDTFEIIESYQYSGEGWGLCTMSEFFVMSNGSNQLAFRDLETFQLIKVVNVTRNGNPVNFLNELECVDDLIFSNIWMTDEIVAIESNSGKIIKSVNASNLINKSVFKEANVLNGIAYNHNDSNYWITGKYWPYMFEVNFEERQDEIISNSTNISIQENNTSDLDSEVKFFESKEFTIFSYSFLFLMIIFWLIDIKFRGS